MGGFALVAGWQLGKVVERMQYSALPGEPAVARRGEINSPAPAQPPSLCRFVGGDLVFVLERQADVVQAVEQAVAAERLDLEGDRQARRRR